MFNQLLQQLTETKTTEQRHAESERRVIAKLTAAARAAKAEATQLANQKEVADSYAARLLLQETEAAAVTTPSAKQAAALAALGYLVAANPVISFEAQIAAAARVAKRKVDEAAAVIIKQCKDTKSNRERVRMHRAIKAGEASALQLEALVAAGSVS